MHTHTSSHPPLLIPFFFYSVGTYSHTRIQTCWLDFIYEVLSYCEPEHVGFLILPLARQAVARERASLPLLFSLHWSAFVMPHVYVLLVIVDCRRFQQSFNWLNCVIYAAAAVVVACTVEVVSVLCVKRKVVAIILSFMANERLWECHNNVKSVVVVRNDGFAEAFISTNVTYLCLAQQRGIDGPKSNSTGNVVFSCDCMRANRKSTS